MSAMVPRPGNATPPPPGPKLGPVCSCGRRHLQHRQYARCYQRAESGLSPWDSVQVVGSGAWAVYVRRRGRPQIVWLFGSVDEALDMKNALDRDASAGTVNLVRKVVP
jgi:hypothetical protein